MVIIMYTVMIPKIAKNYSAVDWVQQHCPSCCAVNTRVIKETKEYVFLFKFEKEEDSILFALRWL